MKFEIKVGKDFEGPITVSVVADREFSFKKAIAYVAIATIAGVVFSTAAYGMATGDYSGLKHLAEAGRNALEAAINIAAKSVK